MKYIIRIQLEHKSDVIRDFEIASDKSLVHLHNTIIESLKLNKNEMASFYKTNDKLDLLQEIPIFKIDEKDEKMLTMSEIKIASVLPEPQSKLIYLYDFLEMWRFLVVFTSVSDNKNEKTEIIHSIGELPKDAPDVIFETDENFTSLDCFEKNLDKEISDEFNNLNETEY